MKIRNGFVSNSSSSSFIVACKNDREDVIKYFKEEVAINDGEDYNWIRNLCSTMGEWFYEQCNSDNRIENVLEEQGDYYDGVDELLSCYGDNDGEAKTLKEKGWKLYLSEAESYGGGSMETFICDNAFDIKSDNIRIIKDEGY